MFLFKNKTSKANVRSRLYYDTFPRDLSEMMARSFSFKDIDEIGRDVFHSYNTHELEGVLVEITVSSLTAASRLVKECIEKKAVLQLFNYLMQIEGNYLNGKIVELHGVEDILYRLRENNYCYSSKKREIVPLDNQKAKDQRKMVNWGGALRDGKLYNLTVASVDVCDHSKCVSRYGVVAMGKVFTAVYDLLFEITIQYGGRVWSWAGDGGIFAFRGKNGLRNSLHCAMAMQLAMVSFNLREEVRMQEIIRVRIGIDTGSIRFFNDVGHIVSEVINYAAHLEKKGTEPSGISVSDHVFGSLSQKFQRLFPVKKDFEDRTAHSMVLDYENGFGLVEKAD